MYLQKVKKILNECTITSLTSQTPWVGDNKVTWYTITVREKESGETSERYTK